MTVLSFNPSAKGSDITLLSPPYETATNLRAAGSAAGGWEKAIGTISQSSGKWYVEFGFGYGGWMCGLANASASLTTWLGNDGDSFGLQNTGGNFNVGGSPGWGSINAQDRVGFAVDVTNSKFWVRINGGAWANGDPVAGTGGGSWSFSGAVYPAICIDCSQSTPTGLAYNGYGEISGSAHDFNTAAPTGFTPWGDLSSFVTSGTETLDPNWITSNSLLASGDLQFIAASTGGAAFGWVSAEGTQVIQNGAQAYFEVTVDLISSGLILGVAGAMNCPVGWVGGNGLSEAMGHGTGAAYDGSTYANGGGSGSRSAPYTFTTGDIVGIAVDLTIRKMWVRVNGGSWFDNGSSPASPVPAVGGYDLNITANAQGFVIPIVSANNAASATINFGPTFAYASPYGGPPPTAHRGSTAVVLM